MAIVSLGNASDSTYSTVASDMVLVREGNYRISRTGDAFRLRHDNAVLTVNGEVYGGDDAIQIEANRVQIHVGKTGVVGANSAGNDTNGVDIAAGTAAARIYNSGRISGAIGVDGSDSGYLSVRNTGEIAGRYTAVFGVDVLYNAGLIQGEVSPYKSDDSAPDSRIENSGTIAGSVSGAGGKDTVKNTGVILGDVYLWEGDDVFDGRGGKVTGRVEGGAGADLYIVDDASVELEEIHIGAGQTDTVHSTVSFELYENIEDLKLIGGNDTSGTGNELANKLTGNSGDNRLSGGAGRDQLLGKTGDDRLLGGFGNDVLEGGRGADQLYGGVGKDKLMGGDDRDVLFGGRGADALNGGSGDDILIGGLGQDILRGADGSDTFRFTRAGQSPNSASRDKVFGFTSGEDAIDVSDLTSRKLDVAIGGLLSGNGPSLRAVINSGDTRILIDTDGDRKADMRIDLVNVTVFDEGDLIF